MSITVTNPLARSLGTTDMAIDIKPARSSQSLNAGAGKRSVNTSDSKSEVDGDLVKKVALSDTVTVTDSVSRLRELESKLADLPEVDSKRVEILRQAISQGKYQVDSASIADSLLRSENDLV